MLKLIFLCIYLLNGDNIMSPVYSNMHSKFPELLETPKAQMPQYRRNHDMMERK